MAVTTKIEFNLKGLENLRREVGSAHKTRVGILGSHAARTEPGSPLNNAEIGVIQMFGSITKNIPARDFLFFPIQSHQREIIHDMQASAVKNAVVAGDFKNVYGLLGAAALKWVLAAFDTSGFGQWAPNAPSTVDKKGSARPLIDIGELRRACTSDVVSRSKA